MPAARNRRTPFRTIALLLVIAGLFSVGIGVGRATGISLAGLFSSQAKAPPGEFPVLEPSVPLRIRIPSVEVNAPVRKVGLDDDGVIGTLALRRRNAAAWYEQGPTPGQHGPAIIVGHVDTKDRPAVFHRLHELRPGAAIEIVRRDRTVAVFEVNSVERFSKEALPANRLYHDFSRPGLRLITCGGRWIGGETGYADNVIVFASLTSSRQD